MKHILVTVLALMMTLVMLCPTVMAESDAAGTTIEVAVNFTGDVLATFEELVDAYEEANGCTVTVSTYGDDFESTLKTRMASNSLPDVWTTHGWSIIRYSEYLMPLNDQPWYSDLDESALGVIADDDGNIYVLMVDDLVNGTLVNLTVCEAAGVDPYAIYDWDDFTEACAKIKEAGYTPIGNSNSPGNLANIAGTWLNYEGEKAELSAEMLDGTFDWENFKLVLNDWANWYANGYLYEDKSTAGSDDVRERWASDKCAFFLGNDTSYLLNARKINPDGNYAFLPTFASTKEGKQFVGVGEGTAFGIWKDTQNEAAAKAFLNYMAQPEVASKMGKATGNISSLKSVADLTKEEYGQKLVLDMQAKYGDVLYENLWDRKYMPSGMWSIFDSAEKMLTDDYSEAGIQDVVDYLAESYTDLWESQNEG